jgi:glycosyltransferase involved in cell wall biosynthesis
MSGNKQGIFSTCIINWCQIMPAKHPVKLFVVEPRGSGGMIHYAYQLCNAFAGHVSDVMLVTAKSYELEEYPHSFTVNKFLNLWTRSDLLFANTKPSFLGKKLRKVFHNIRRVARGVRYIVEWIKLVNYLVRVRPDVVQFGKIEFPFESLFLGYLKSRGLILTQICHEFEPREIAGGLFVGVNNHLQKSVFDNFAITFFHSESNRERFKVLYPSVDLTNSHIIPMGNGQIFPLVSDYSVIQIALKKRYGISDAESVVLFFGNITPSKGVDDLLHAFAIVYAVSKSARLIIAGMPLKYIDIDSLVNLAEALGIQSATVFDTRYLPLEEVRPLIELADVVVYPYVSSTQSASIQAAYAFGKPVVATRVGGLPDIVVDGESGYLVSPQSPKELSDAILKIINNDELAQRMGLFAKNLSETRFSWLPIAGNIVDVYVDFLRENKSDGLL